MDDNESLRALVPDGPEALRRLRTVLPLLGGALAVGLLGSLAHLVLMPASTPRRAAVSYSKAARAGDLDALRHRLENDELDRRSRQLGEAWHDRVEQAFRNAAVEGAMQSYAMFERFEDAKDDSRSDWYKLNWRDRPEDRDAWLKQKTLERLSSTDREMLLDYDDEEPTLWHKVGVGGQPAWRSLSWRTRRNIEKSGDTAVARYIAENGAWNVAPTYRERLVDVGKFSVSDEDRALVDGVTLEDWSYEGSFVTTHGDALLSAAYQWAYQGERLSQIEVERGDPEGMLYKPGEARVTGTAGQVEFSGRAVRGLVDNLQGSWLFTNIQDLDVDLLAARLRSAEAVAFRAELEAAGGAE
jgi:hypothetical protein